MSSSLPPTSSASVRNLLTLLASRGAHLVAGAEGLERQVTWATHMRARLPAFESMRGGELALLGLSQLRRVDETLPHLLQSLHQERIAAVAVAAASLEALGNEAPPLADQLHLPLILLPLSAQLEEIEREVITFVVSFPGEIERKATEISHQLMQLSIQGVGIQGVCEHLARISGNWVVVQDAEQNLRFAAPPEGTNLPRLPAIPTDDILLDQGLARITVPIQIRHEVVGYLTMIREDSDIDYLQRMILGQAAPIMALEFARERERGEVESRYQSEALMDVLQGNYTQPGEMLARARLLGYDLSIPQVVVIFEISSSVSGYSADNTQALWEKRLRDELLRTWPTCWLSFDPRRTIALLPLPPKDGRDDHARDSEKVIFTQLQRVYTRLQQSKAGNSHLPLYSGAIGRIARDLQEIPQSFREAQQALEIGQRLFGDGKLHSFARLGIYRLLFFLNGHDELSNFYRETLGPLLDQDARNNGALIETLEGFFQCNGNLSETARTMHLHRNSLLYRLTRIEELLGRSLEDPELRLSLQIALKIRHLLAKRN